MILPALLGLVYTGSSAGETIVIKALNYGSPPLKLPTYTGFMSNQLWVLMLPVYVWMLYSKKSYTVKYIPKYIVMGLLTFAATILRNISVTVMPGSVFGLLINTSIVFNMFLSWFWLHKKFNMWHFFAAVTCLSSGLTIGVAALMTSEEAESGVDYIIGIPTAIAAAFCVAFITVWQEHVQPTLDDLNLRLVEMIIASSIISAMLIIVYATFSKEMTAWTPSIEAAATSNKALIAGCSVALPILKLLVRNSKYTIIQKSNAFFFEFIQASAALIGSFANILIFGEPWGPAYIAAIILMACSFALYVNAKLVEKEAEKLPTVMPPPPPYINPLKLETVSWK
jgi:hypothetical protein